MSVHSLYNVHTMIDRRELAMIYQSPLNVDRMFYLLDLSQHHHLKQDQLGYEKTRQTLVGLSEIQTKKQRPMSYSESVSKIIDIHLPGSM